MQEDRWDEEDTNDDAARTARPTRVMENFIIGWICSVTRGSQ